MKKIQNHHPRAHFVNNNNGSLVFTPWELGVTISTTSILLIRTSSNWLHPEQLRSH